ncbi:MAG TPA: hypothetical protein VHR45_22970 [Thermoanaerobaculia bacterium]|nr:hypothetical protein [Thermoanaerobaculia bacterium]
MSRIPRFQEHLKTAFTAEAVSAARFRAYAERAREDELPHLAQRWLRLAAGKDRLAIQLLVAAEQVRGFTSDLGTAIAEERYEDDVLYPKMMRDLDGTGEAWVAALFAQVVATQSEQLRDLEALREELNASSGDVRLPAEAAAAAAPAAPASRM